MSTVDYFEIDKKIVRDQTNEALAARAELRHLIAIYGPVDVLKAARIGLQQRANHD